MAVVAGVVVTYHPNVDKLHRLLGSVYEQVSEVIIVDNGPDEEVGAWLKTAALPRQPRYVALCDNRGVGAAQNVGIRLAVQAGASHVVLLDQDSAPEAGMVAQLLQGEDDLLSRGVQVAAVGPQLYDESSGTPFRFIQFAWGIKRRVDSSRVNGDWVETHHLVASGTMVRASVFEQVGLMREDLFIEYVDVEWGLRARSKGLRSFGIKRAKMLHNLGDRSASVLFGLKSVPLHSPLRHYYTVRNALCMQQLGYVPFTWKVNDAIRTVLGFAYYGLCSPPRHQQMAMMLRGVRDAFLNRLGRFAE